MQTTLSFGDGMGCLLFFPQRLGLHKNMGRLWMRKTIDGLLPNFSAYVDRREFVRALYLSLMTHLGFDNYDINLKTCEDYPTGEDRDKAWEAYNAFKSPLVEWYITDDLYGHVPMPTAESQAKISESFAMFPDFGMCALWDTMGVGSGDCEHLDTDSGEFEYHIDGFEEWLSEYDCSYKVGIRDFDDYWRRGWRIALELRKLLPEHIDLFYMCYDPLRPAEIIDYACWYPRIIVPRIE